MTLSNEATATGLLQRPWTRVELGWKHVRRVCLHKYKLAKPMSTQVREGELPLLSNLGNKPYLAQPSDYGCAFWGVKHHVADLGPRCNLPEQVSLPRVATIPWRSPLFQLHDFLNTYSKPFCSQCPPYDCFYQPLGLYASERLIIYSAKAGSRLQITSVSTIRGSKYLCTQRVRLALTSIQSTPLYSSTMMVVFSRQKTQNFPSKNYSCTRNVQVPASKISSAMDAIWRY